ncbi:MAG TPA: ATP-binding protein [Verrucomicrobiae bacterium]
MKFRAGILSLVCLLTGVTSAFAQRSAHVRVFRPAGGYPANVTVSPSGSIVSRSGDNPNVLILDGFLRQEVAMGVETSYRVYQSRSMQLWSLTREGVQLYHAGDWTFHPIAEIRNELATNPIRQIRQLGLLPAEVNSVFILLPDRLLDYDADKREAMVIKWARETQLGEFMEIHEGANESIWISGTFGFAQVTGPMRRVTAATEWKEYLLPNTNLVNTLQRPYEFPAGTVTASANSPATEGARYVVQLEGERFSTFPIIGERIKQAWGGWDRSLWGYSSTALLRMDREPQFRVRKEPVSGAQYDIACDANGVFWVASSEGLVRYAPHLWRAPAGLDELQTSIHALVFDRAGIGWAASPEGLVRIENGKTETFRWPEAMENFVPQRDSLFAVEGGVLVAADRRALLFDLASRRFSNLELPASGAQFLGTLRNGAICVWFRGTGEDPVDLRTFNGRSFERMELPSFSMKGSDLVLAYETARGELWFGTTSGAIQVKPVDGTVEYHGVEKGLGGERVTAFAEVGEGRIWCGTTSRVYEFADQRWERRLNAGDRVNSIVSALGSTWVATSAGIRRFLEGSWIPYSDSEGISSGAVYALQQASPDQLWAATTRGLLRFFPDADRDAPRTLPPVLEESQTPSTLEPTMVSFRGSDKWDYTSSHELLYSYRLDETPWTPFSNKTSRVFQNLSSGTHIIEVRTMDRNGNISAGTSRAEFAVIVPWSRDPRLLVVSILAAGVTLVFAGYAVTKHLQLKRSYAEVERIVRQRTAELERANQELLHSQKMRAIGTMAAGIAHDFNNILSIIRGSAQIIEGNVHDKEKIKTRVNRIQTVVEQGTTIVKALLGLGRVNEQELSECDVVELLHETKRLLSDRFPPEVQLQVEANEKLPEVLCSREVLQQMLLNFILNSVEAIGGSGVVRLCAREVREVPQEHVLKPAEASSYVSISVSDSGTGIPPETLPRIFEPFFTTKAFSSRRGTGLGLSMVYELAKGLGYGVAVTSVVGEGSSFSILLPRRASPRPAERRESQTVESRS